MYSPIGDTKLLFIFGYLLLSLAFYPYLPEEITSFLVREAGKNVPAIQVENDSRYSHPQPIEPEKGD